jgi:hypothetical protein
MQCDTSPSRYPDRTCTRGAPLHAQLPSALQADQSTTMVLGVYRAVLYGLFPT